LAGFGVAGEFGDRAVHNIIVAAVAAFLPVHRRLRRGYSESYT
jgi:hypothetical protein